MLKYYYRERKRKNILEKKTENICAKNIENE
jgi:hypothetical protein